MLLFCSGRQASKGPATVLHTRPPLSILLGLTLVTTSKDMSTRPINKSEITPLTYAAAPFSSLFTRIMSSTVATTLRTKPQLSRLTVSIPLLSILSHLSVLVHNNPA